MNPNRNTAGLLEPGERWGWEYRPQHVPGGDAADAEPAGPAVPAPEPWWSDEIDPIRVFVFRRRADIAYRAWRDACAAPDGGRSAAPATVRPPVVRPMWAPVSPAGTAGRVRVYGGTPDGWAALLATVGGSLLGSGIPVTIVDLSGDSVSRRLVTVAGTAGHRLDLLTLPDHLPSVHLLADLTASQAGAVIAEAVHAVDRDPGTGEQAADAGLVGQAIGCLRGPITFDRVHAALLALRGGAVPPLLAASEAANLAALLPPGGGVPGGRLRRLTAAVAQLAALAGADQPVHPYRDPAAELRVLQLAEPEPGGHTDLLAQVVFGALVHQVRGQLTADTGPHRMLVVCGADELRRSDIERLDGLARRRRIRLVLMFRRLRPDALAADPGEPAPPGRHTDSPAAQAADATVLMRAGSDAEAARMAAFVGPHRVLLGPATAAATADGRTLPGPPQVPTTPVGPYPSAAPPPPADAAIARRADAALLRGLSETAFVLVDRADEGSPRLADCASAILAEPRLPGTGGEAPDGAAPPVPLWASDVPGPHDADGHG